MMILFHKTTVSLKFELYHMLIATWLYNWKLNDNKIWNKYVQKRGYPTSELLSECEIKVIVLGFFAYLEFSSHGSSYNV